MNSKGCITCKSERVSRFIDGFGKNRIFCRSCWTSFPENIIKFNNPRNSIYINVVALNGGDI